MFGAIKPCKGCLTEQQRAAYKKHYCGLCFALHENYGKMARLLINYDLTNDYLLTGSSRNDGVVKTGRCPWSLLPRKVEYITYPEVSDYYAKLNFILVYYNLLDDVRDDGSPIARWITGAMEKHLPAQENELQRETALLQTYLERLHRIEEENQHLPVMEVARHFGELLRDMVKPPFVFEVDEGPFSMINYWVGIWIYTVDAIVDVIDDGFKKQYNPILAGLKGNPLQLLRGRKQELLDILRQCVENISQLLEIYPTYENTQLLQRLFSGELTKILCIYLEVEKDELIAQSKAAASGGLQ